MSEIADEKEDEIIFEMNEEFSLLNTDFKPKWFQFSDLKTAKEANFIF